MEENLTDWLTNKEVWLTYFNKPDIEKAIKKTKLTKERLTDIENFEREPFYREKRELDKDWHMTKVNRYMTYKGKQWKTTENAQVQTWRIPSRYQGLVHKKIIREILKARFKWFDEFKWELYEMSLHYELYLKTQYGSLYVPLQALTQEYAGLISSRHRDYHTDYHGSSSYSLNKREGETLEEFKKRKQADTKKAMRPLQSKEAEKLFSYLLDGDKQAVEACMEI